MGQTDALIAAERLLLFKLTHFRFALWLLGLQGVLLHSGVIAE